MGIFSFNKPSRAAGSRALVPNLIASAADMDSTPLLSAVGGLPGPNVMQDHVS
jgi:hypothetical protein